MIGSAAKDKGTCCMQAYPATGCPRPILPKEQFTPRSPVFTVSQRGWHNLSHRLRSAGSFYVSWERWSRGDWGKVWFSLSTSILLISSQMLSLTRKGPKCALLPLLKQRDVAAAVWVMWRLPEEEEGKIQDLTRQVRGMQAVSGKWDHPHWGPATSWGWGPRLLRKVPSTGKQLLSFYRGLSLFTEP